jgi:hypothetical protein
LIVEHLQEGGEALQIAIVWGRQEEQTMLEVRRDRLTALVRSESTAYWARPEGAMFWASSTISGSKRRG